MTIKSRIGIIIYIYASKLGKDIYNAKILIKEFFYCPYIILKILLRFHYYLYNISYRLLSRFHNNI